jgi:hypothetical protein
MALRFLIDKFSAGGKLSPSEVQDEMKVEYRSCEANVEYGEIRNSLVKSKIMRGASNLAQLDNLQDGAYGKLEDVLAAVQNAFTPPNATEEVPLKAHVRDEVTRMFWHCKSCDVSTLELADRLRQAKCPGDKSDAALFAQPDPDRMDAPTFLTHPMFGLYPMAGSKDGLPMQVPERFTWPQMKKLWASFNSRYAEPVLTMHRAFVKMQEETFGAMSSKQQKELIAEERALNDQEIAAAQKAAATAAEAAASARILAAAEENVEESKEEAEKQDPVSVPTEQVAPMVVIPKKLSNDKLRKRVIARLSVPVWALFAHLYNKKVFDSNHPFSKSALREEWKKEAKRVFKLSKGEKEAAAAVGEEPVAAGEEEEEEEKNDDGSEVNANNAAPKTVTWREIDEALLELMPEFPSIAQAAESSRVSQSQLPSQAHSHGSGSGARYLGPDHDPADSTFSPILSTNKRRTLNIVRAGAALPESNEDLDAEDEDDDVLNGGNANSNSNANNSNSNSNANANSNNGGFFGSTANANNANADQNDAAPASGVKIPIGMSLVDSKVYARLQHEKDMFYLLLETLIDNEPHVIFVEDKVKEVYERVCAMFQELHKPIQQLEQAVCDNAVKIRDALKAPMPAYQPAVLDRPTPAAVSTHAHVRITPSEQARFHVDAQGVHIPRTCQPASYVRELQNLKAVAAQKLRTIAHPKVTMS